MSNGERYVIGIVGGWLVVLFGCLLAFRALSWLFRALFRLFS